MVGEKIVTPIEGKIHTILQWEYVSKKVYTSPFNDIELDIVITSPAGESWTIPTFWMGNLRWGIRFRPNMSGKYHVRSLCSDTNNPELHNVEDILMIISAPSVSNYLPILKQDNTHTYLVDENKNPFLWLADTWWMALSSRLTFPKEFKHLTNKRKEQGFNVIMLVAGLMPDMDSFDTRCANEAGLPWEKDYTQINPLYFDKADERIEYLIKEGMIPCILGAWGYYLQHMGEEKMKKHWRYIIARWGVYPVIWCIAGEATMPYYLSKERNTDMQMLYEGWSNIASYIHTIDPFKRLLTIHPTEIGREQISNQSLLDINFIQAGHNGYPSVGNMVKLLTQEHNKKTKIPLIVGEVNYEGILQDTHAAVQRLTFWAAMLSGAKGFSYGANGIWQINTPKQPFGASPHGGVWGNTSWQESLLYQGAKQLGYAKKILERYPWWDIEAQQHTLTPYSHLKDPKEPRIGGISTSLRIIYFYGPVPPWKEPKYKITHLEKNTLYTAYFWDPQTAKHYPIGIIKTSNKGEWEIPHLPTFEDWVLIIEQETQVNHETYTNLQKIKNSFMTQLKYHVKHFLKKR